jgi:chromosome segregation ATPase
MRLDIAVSEHFAQTVHGLKADEELKILRDTNAKLDASESDLLDRLTSAEEDLANVRNTNIQLEEFLNSVNSKMVATEASLKDNEKHMKEFVKESEAKLEESRVLVSKYEQQLSSKERKLEELTDHNSKLHHQIDDQEENIISLSKDKEIMVEELHDKEQFVEELSSSSEKRLKDIHAAYDKLRRDHDAHLQEERKAADDSHKRSNSHLRNEMHAKDATIAELRQTKEEFAMSFASLEQEVRELREDKKAFEALVATLQEKINHLEVLEEWQNAKSSAPVTPSRTRNHIEWKDQGTPSRNRNLSPIPSSTGGSLRSQPSIVSTCASIESSPEDLDDWAKEVERIRMQRDEQVIRLQGMRKERDDLKRTLKESEHNLYELERRGRS